jgi:hypothetical protein
MQMVGSLRASQARVISWRGRSGRAYAMQLVELGSFMLQEQSLHLLAKGTFVLWAGSADDVISDHASRARFRLALTLADRAFRIEGVDPVERMTTVWDLEGAEPRAELSGVAA